MNQYAYQRGVLYRLHGSYFLLHSMHLLLLLFGRDAGRIQGGQLLQQKFNSGILLQYC
jgi:hypothetical protein